MSDQSVRSADSASPGARTALDSSSASASSAVAPAAQAAPLLEPAATALAASAAVSASVGQAASSLARHPSVWPPAELALFPSSHRWELALQRSAWQVAVAKRSTQGVFRPDSVLPHVITEPENSTGPPGSAPALEPAAGSSGTRPPLCTAPATTEFEPAAGSSAPRRPTVAAAAALAPRAAVAHQRSTDAAIALATDVGVAATDCAAS